MNGISIVLIIYSVDSYYEPPVFVTYGLRIGIVLSWKLLIFPFVAPDGSIDAYRMPKVVQRVLIAVVGNKIVDRGDVQPE